MIPPVPDRGCLEAETLAAWHEGTLSAAEVAAVDSHLADCDRCQALLAAFVRTDVAEAVPATPAVESLWRRWRLSWLVPVATAATVAAVWVALPDRDSITRPTTSESDLPATAERQLLPEPPAAQADADQAEAGSQAAANDLQAKAETLEEARTPAAAPPAAPEASAGVLPASPAEPGDAAFAAETTLQELNREAPAAPPARPRLADQAGARAAAAEAATPARPRAETSSVEVVSPDAAAPRWRIAAGRVERSTTGGSSWQPVTGVPAGAVVAGSAPAASICWLIGAEGAVYLTTDGATFARLPFPEDADLTGVTALDALTATVTAADGRTWRTTDAGQTWD